MNSGQQERVERRLAAILAADVAGYSRMMGADEEGTIGKCKILTGPIKDGIAAQQQAIRLSPRDPMIGIWYFRIGQAHLLRSHIEEAIL
jgi:hypothetical protein